MYIKEKEMVLVNVQNQVLSDIAIARKASKRQSISKQFKMGVLFCFVFVFSDFQSKETTQKSTNPRIIQLTVSTPLNLITCLPFDDVFCDQTTAGGGWTVF